MNKLILILILNSILFSNSFSQIWELSDKGIYGGNISSILYYQNKLLIGTGNGIYESVDHGSTWTTLTNFFANQSVISLANDGNIIYTSCFRGKTYTSSDEGNTWVPISPISGFIFVYQNKLFVNNLMSPDSGKSWIDQRLNGLSVSTIRNMNNIDSILFATSLNGQLFRSTNGGKYWFPIVLFNFKNTSQIAIDGDKIFVGTGSEGIYMSSDYGDSWTQMNNGLTNLIIEGLANEGDTLLVSNDDGYFRSSDGGQHWEPVNHGIFSIGGSGYGDRIGSSIFIKNNDFFVANTLGGLFHSSDCGQNWNISNNGIQNITYYYGINSFKNNIILGTLGGGLYISSDNGSDWKERNSGFTFFQSYAGTHNEFLTVNSDYFYFLADTAGLFLSKINGNDWKYSSADIPNFLSPESGYSFICDFNDTLFISNQGIYRSYDKGNNWVEIGSKYNLINISYIVSDKNQLIVVENGDSVFISSDNGNTWTYKNSDIFSNNYSTISALAIKGKYLFLGTMNKGMYVSSDRGDSWNQINNGLTDLNITGFETYKDFLFVGTNNGGTFVSSNLGQKWFPIDSGLSDLNISGMSIGDKFLYVTTGDTKYYPHIYRLSLDNFVEIHAEIKLSDTTALIGNNNFILPLYARLDSTSDTTITNMKYSAELRWNASYFYPDSAEGILITNNTTNGGNREILFEDLVPLLDTNWRQIARIHGKMLMAPKETIPLTISKFSWVDSTIIDSLKNGSLSVSGKCIQTLSQIQFLQPLEFSILPTRLPTK